MRNLLLQACCYLAGLTAAVRFSDGFDKNTGVLDYARLIPRADRRSPSPERPGSRTRPRFALVGPSTRSEESIGSSVLQKFPSQQDISKASSSSVMKKPSTVPPLGNLIQTSDFPSLMPKQAAQSPRRGSESSMLSRGPNRSSRLKRIPTPGPLKLHDSKPSRSRLLDMIPPEHMTGPVRGRYTALAIADGPAYLEGGVLGKPSTGKVVLPGRTGVLSIAHDKDTVWATGSVGKGASTVAAAIGEGVTAQALVGYEGKGYMKSYGPDGHSTHTDVAPGKKEDQQWEVIDPTKNNMGATVGVDGPGQATAGGLNLQHTSKGKDYQPVKPQ